MVEIKKHSGIYTLTTEQVLLIDLNEAWEFFTSPKNLQKLTPSKMGFNITSKVESKAYVGQIITYKIGLLLGIKSNWVTEITSVTKNSYFVDEQRFGPYSMWHHEHWFEALPDGKTLIKDKVSYKIPFGILGHLAQQLFIKNELKTIFEYRYATLKKMFG